MSTCITGVFIAKIHCGKLSAETRQHVDSWKLSTTSAALLSFTASDANKILLGRHLHRYRVLEAPSSRSGWQPCLQQRRIHLMMVLEHCFRHPQPFPQHRRQRPGRSVGPCSPIPQVMLAQRSKLQALGAQKGQMTAEKKMGMRLEAVQSTTTVTNLWGRAVLTRGLGTL